MNTVLTNFHLVDVVKGDIRDDAALVIHNGSIDDELETMVACEWPPIEALRSATVAAAEAMGMDGTIGSIEVGKKADMVAVSHNPLTDITNLRNVTMVMKEGALIVSRPG